MKFSNSERALPLNQFLAGKSVTGFGWKKRDSPRHPLLRVIVVAKKNYRNASNGIKFQSGKGLTTLPATMTFR